MKEAVTRRHHHMKKITAALILGVVINIMCACDSSLSKKQTLEIVGFDISSKQEEILSAFQEKYPEIEMQVTDYAQDGDFQTALQRLNADIMGKNVGDILIANTLIPIGQYVEKGILWNLEEAEGIEEVKQTLLPSVVKTCEKGGKMYSIFSDFSINCFAGKKEVLSDDKWNAESVSKVFDELADKECNVFSSRSKTVYEEMLIAMVEEDVKKNRMITKDQEMIRFMESSRRLIEISDNAPVREPENQQPYQSGEIPVSWEFIGGFNEFYYLNKVKYAEEDILLKGNPISVSVPLFDTSLELSVFQSSEQKELAWKYISFLLSEEYQDKYYSEERYVFPVNQKVFDKVYEAVLAGLEPGDEEGMVETDYRYVINGKEVDIGIPTKEDLQPLLDTIHSMDSIRKYDKEIIQIVTEQMRKYVANGGSAKSYVEDMKYKIGVLMEERR